MPDSKITALTSISTSTDPSNDPLVIVDVSDTSMAATGTTKKVTLNQLLGASGTATLASATISGALTVGNGTSATQTFNGVTNILDIGFGSLRGGSAYGDVRLWTDRFRIYNNAGTQIIKNISGTNGDETWYDGAGGTRMTLNATGLGVGTGPTSKLTIGTGAYAAGTLSGTSSLYSTVAQGLCVLADGFNIATRAGADRFTLDATGNVGIGVTPSATDSTYYQALEIARVGQGLTCVKTAFTSTPNSWLSNNSYATYSAGTVWKYAVSSQLAAQYRLAGGEHQWFNAPSGTAGNAITFTQAMTLDASGRLILLASTTTPATLSTNGQLTFTATSDTNLRFSYRGSDGVTRVANLTLA